VDPSTLNALRAAEEAVGRLVEHCRKAGTLYRRSPRAVAHISRTGKWHLNAIAALRKALDKDSVEGRQQQN
jgi:hypothetical protein